MERLESIPEHIKGALARHEIWPAGIQLFAGADLSPDGEYCDVWMAVTDKDFVILSGHDNGEKVKLFSGFKSTTGKKDKKGKKTADWIETGFETIPLSDIEKIRIDNLASSGMLTATVKGEDRALCCFTNSNARKMGMFLKLADKLREGKELTDEDLKDEHAPACCPKCGLLYPEQDRKICPRCMDKRSLFMRVLSFVPRYKLQITLIIICMLASSGLNLLLPYLSGNVLYDQVLTKGGARYGEVGLVVLAIIITRLVALLLSIAYSRINAGMTAEVIFDLKTEIFSAMQRLSLSFYNRKQTGSLMTRVNNDTMHLQYFFHDGLPFFIVNALNILGIGAVMVWMNWKLAIMVLVPTPFIVLYLKRTFPRLWKVFHKRYRKASTMNSIINDTLKGTRVVKAFGKEGVEIDRFARSNEGVYDVDMKAGTINNTVFPIVHFVMGIGGLIIWGLGGWNVVSGSMSFGSLMTFIGYIGMIYGPLQFMTQVIDWWSSCMNSAQRIFEVLDAVPDVSEKKDPVRLNNMKGHLVMKNVSFSYEPNKPVLHNVSIEVKPGEMLGLVGKSGAGKSTIANLITRLYDPEEGTVTIDGVDLRDACIADLRSQIAMVSQESYLFMGTIAENIAYAKPDATFEEIVAAAKAANAHDFIMKTPDGYDSIIGTGGRDLSGGERQRLSIARAILHDPKILILDEATSAVDTETEGMIQEALEKLVKGRTTISIAHRLSTLRNADKLVVVEDGKIVESGTHHELIAKKGAYFNLVQKQSEALKMRGVGD